MPSFILETLSDVTEESVRRLDSRRKSNTTSSNMPSTPAQHSTTALDPMTAEEQRLTRDVKHGAPGDPSPTSSKKSDDQQLTNKKRSQYYDDIFNARGANCSVRDRVLRESVVMAEVKTNVIVTDEYTFITDLSYNLSSRYQRSESSIVVSLVHSACLIFGGTFEPAYTLTITALPSQVQPVTNKRNAALLSKGMQDALGVTPSRGVIKFVAIPEECYATNGKTIIGEIEELVKEEEDSGGWHKGVRSNSQNGICEYPAKTKKKPSLRNLRSFSLRKKRDSTLITQKEQKEEDDEVGDMTYTPPESPVKSSIDGKAGRMKRKSFASVFFGR